MNLKEIFKFKEIIPGHVREVWIYGDAVMQNEVFDSEMLNALYDFEMQNEIDDIETRRRIHHRRKKDEITMEVILEFESVMSKHFETFLRNNTKG